MIAAALLASPFLLDYDLVLLGIPLAWIARESLRTGFLPWEKIIARHRFRTARGLAVDRDLCGPSLAPLVIAAVFVLVLRRAGEIAPAPAPRERRSAGSCRELVEAREKAAFSRAGQTMIDMA